jgi:hypothetical protein
VELPLSMVLKGSNKTLGMWGVTARQDTFYEHFRGHNNEPQIVEYFGPYHQIQRDGNPVIKVIFLPDEVKNFYNITQPHDDPQNFGPILWGSMHQPRFTGFTDAEITRLIGIFAPDTLKLDVTKPVKYPNGRWLDDDVVDIIFSSILFDGNPIFFKPGELDGVNHNDVPFSDSFPYLAPPHQAP